MLSTLIKKLLQRNNLSSSEAKQLLESCLDPKTEPYQIVAALVLLHAKGETAEELLALRNVLLDQMLPAPTHQPTLLDIVGTGGDGAQTFNISTSAAILAASCGAHVAKHGNRAVSSQCGSADLISALGIPLDLSAKQIASCIEQCGIGFYFAPQFHPALKQLRELRKRLGVPTSFNLLGPLLNPARPTHYLCGVANSKLVPIIADVFALDGNIKALVFNGHGVDELTCIGPTEAILVQGKNKKSLSIDPQKFGLKKCSLEDLRGGDAQHNIKLLKAILAGESSPLADTIALNAGVALFVCGLANDMNDGVKQAQQNLQNGAAAATLAKWLRLANQEKKV